MEKKIDRASPFMQELAQRLSSRNASSVGVDHFTAQSSTSQSAREAILPGPAVTASERRAREAAEISRPVGRNFDEALGTEGGLRYVTELIDVPPSRTSVRDFNYSEWTGTNWHHSPIFNPRGLSRTIPDSGTDNGGAVTGSGRSSPGFDPSQTLPSPPTSGRRLTLKPGVAFTNPGASESSFSKLAAKLSELKITPGIALAPPTGGQSASSELVKTTVKNERKPLSLLPVAAKKEHLQRDKQPDATVEGIAR